MNILNNITTFLCLLLIAFALPLQSQEQGTLLEGEMQGEKSNSNESIVADKIVVLEKNEEITEEDGIIKKRYKIVTINEKGEREEMVWEGEEDEEMPAEMKALLKSEDLEKVSEKEESKEVEVEVIEDEKSGKKVKIKIVQNGKQKEFEFETQNGMIPEDAQKFLDEEGVDLDIDNELSISDKGKRTAPKGQLGVMIKDEERGVLVTDIIKGSSAEESGLKHGDIITAIDDTPIKTMRELVNKISSYKAGDELVVAIIRNDENISKNVILKKRTPRTWDEVMGKK